MPTANRPQFISYAIDYFLHQDYPNAELVIMDSGTQPVKYLIPEHPRIHYQYIETARALGTMRNLCCEASKGEIIVHWDDDDWYAQDWITKQVEALTSSNSDITGLKDINYFYVKTNKRWEYRDVQTTTPWLYGATLAYWKSYWEMYPFNQMNTGEDNVFVSNPTAKIRAHNYTEGYLGIIHNDNKGIVLFENPREKLRVEKAFKTIDTPNEYRKNKFTFPNKELPLITCIMPTANRVDFVISSIKLFLNQNYPNKELMIIDDGENSISGVIPENPQIRYFYFNPKNTIGTKRNWACERANGELITHWDDDDWYAEDWLSYQVYALLNSEADIAGINQVQFFSPSLNKYWMTKNSNSKRPWLTGQSLIYKRSFWEHHPFKDLQIGEDDDFVRNNDAKIFAHDYFQGFIATVHENNTSIKFFEDPEHLNL